MSSYTETSNIFQGTMSRAGKASADRYNILGQISNLQEKKSFKDVFIKESDIDGFNKEEENQKNQEQTQKKDVKLRVNIKKCFKDYIKKVINKTLLSNKQTPKNKNKSKNDKLSPLKNNSRNQSALDEIFKSIQDDIIRSKMKKPEVDKETLSPFYNKIKYKFYNLHINRLRESKKNKKAKRYPVYKPNLEYIYSKSLSGPEWKIILGRKKNIFENHSHCLDKFYNVDSSILKGTKKIFINMKKQMERNLVDSYETKNKNEYDSKIISNENSKVLTPYKSFEHIPYIKSGPIPQIKTDKNKSEFKINKSISPFVKKCRTIIDFKKSLGRYPKEKNLNKELANSYQGIYYPNYDSVKERIKMMVLYGNKNNGQEKIKNFNENKFKGLNSTDFFSSIDVFDKLCIHKPKFVLKFEKMTPRPQDKNLPSFMKGLYNRLGSNIMTDKSLKLNNYSNGESHFDIYKSYSTFSKDHIKYDNDITNSYIDNECDFEENKVNDFNEIEEEKKTNRIKFEINKIVSKMDRMYNNYINSKF